MKDEEIYALNFGTGFLVNEGEHDDRVLEEVNLTLTRGQIEVISTALMFQASFNQFNNEHRERARVVLNELNEKTGSNTITLIAEID